MKVYVAGSIRYREQAAEAMNIIREYGHEITFDWLSEEGEIRDEWSTDAPTRARARMLSAREVQAVKDADAVVVLAHKDAGRGMYIEMGVALGMGKRVYVVLGEDRPESVFFYGENVVRLLVGGDPGHLRRLLTWLFSPDEPLPKFATALDSP